ncbi:unnamed protein product [Fraxinus pennsylvanica]|uniref:non-specific serine/threonine protein kinase n=1 Tax=Fraxinus pennsylvanica TaxID=56036 RepID=A0AAD1ZP14_9LAMI|nr:unnamed protein product [Fraxinus pennsylvanica]
MLSNFAARALHSIFQLWGISGTSQRWNISGELCSGVAIDDTAIRDINPGIKCDCSFNNRTVCRITALRVYALDVVGPIPNELWNLTYLTNLNLGQNYLTGPLPASIGNLARIQYLSLGVNALSGELPRELGMLTDLRSLSFNTNDFSGPLPSELGNLTRLTQIYFDSAGVSGPIPPTFSSLTGLEKVYASDNEFTGQIPDFIGNWSNLLVLRFQGNSFQGPIPPSFSNLTYLNDLRISDLSNGSSTLDFLRNMTSLGTLVLRNNKISGSIPSNIDDYRSLTLLDLSFNNLIGRIPDLLFSLSSLTNLFLGNNNLNGTLPAVKGPTLRNIDLSYNSLSGSFPTWISEQNLQLNLVANRFTIDNSNGSALPSGLNCLQQNFPCGRGSPTYQIVYEMDSESLGPATHYTIDTNRWAVSNVGLPSGSNSPQYRNTLESELFQTARISAGSLRYYGLGLENGNYTVTLQFAEIQILGTRTWRSLGKRVFDVYIQGKLELKDFDVLKEAGGTALRAVKRKLQVEVSENYLEIHLFWAGKGTCCIPAQGTYGPLISAISATPDFVPTVRPPSRKHNGTGLIVGIVVAVGAVIFLSVFVAYYLAQRRRKKKSYEDEEFLGMDTRPYTFNYAELRAATDDFNPDYKLGEGGFGPVYRETESLCFGGAGNRSLSLDWPTRFEICLGVARDFGLAKLYDDKKTHISTRVAGTIGYLAPEYAMRGHLTEKADVFSFGVVVLEIVSGRPNSDSSLEDDKMYLLEWAWNLQETNQEMELLDRTLFEVNEDEVKRIIGVALLCSQTSPGLRPSMSRVVSMLSGDIEVPPITSKPGYLTDWTFNDATTFMLNMDSSTSRTDISQGNPSNITSVATTDPSYSPISDSKPILHEIIGRASEIK